MTKHDQEAKHSIVQKATALEHHQLEDWCKDQCSRREKKLSMKLG